MHLLHVFATFGRGGPQVRFGQVVARGPQDWRHTVVAMDGCVDAWDHLPAGAPVELAPTPVANSFPQMARRFRTVLGTVRPQVLCTYNWGAIEAVAGARGAGVPLVHHEDGFGPEELTRRFRRRNLLRRWLLRRARAVVVPSVRLGDLARREWGVAADRLEVLPNGVDLKRFASARRASGAGFVFGTVGGLRGEKDHANLLRALARIDDLAVTVRIVGDGPLRPALEQQARTLGIETRVVFVGPLADPADELASWDGFVLPSRTEQMPLSLLEAMATGLPVVATDVGDVRQIVAGDNRDLIVPAADPGAFAAAMQKLLASPDLCRRLGAANRSRCEAHYELGACMDRFVAIYRSAGQNS